MAAQQQRDAFASPRGRSDMRDDRREIARGQDIGKAIQKIVE
jgi:hypothetical protein